MSIRKFFITGAVLTAALLFDVALAAPEHHNETDPTEQPFVCDENGAGTGSSQFISAGGRLALRLSIADKGPVEVGATFKNVAGLPAQEIAVDAKGETSSTFGPYLILSYKLPGGKLAGRVVHFTQGQAVTVSPDGFAHILFTGKAIGLPDGTTIQGLEIMVIGENGGGSASIGDVTINGVLTAKLMNTQATCAFVP